MRKNICILKCNYDTNLQSIKTCVFENCAQVALIKSSHTFVSQISIIHFWQKDYVSKYKSAKFANIFTIESGKNRGHKRF